MHTTHTHWTRPRHPELSTGVTTSTEPPIQAQKHTSNGSATPSTSSPTTTHAHVPSPCRKRAPAPDAPAPVRLSGHEADTKPSPNLSAPT